MRSVTIHLNCRSTYVVCALTKCANIALSQIHNEHHAPSIPLSFCHSMEQLGAYIFLLITRRIPLIVGIIKETLLLRIVNSKHNTRASTRFSNRSVIIFSRNILGRQVFLGSKYPRNIILYLCTAGKNGVRPGHYIVLFKRKKCVIISETVTISFSQYYSIFDLEIKYF